MKNTNWIALPLLFRALLLLPATGGIALLLPGCVTVNVNIPAADVQKASDDYVKELYEAKAAKPKPSPSPSNHVVSKPSAMSLLIPEALAAGHEISTHSPKMNALMTRMRTRLEQIIPLKRSGVLGESNDGKLVVRGRVWNRPVGKATADENRRIKKLVSDTNRDREALYQEILEHNGISKAGIGTVRHSFAHSFQSHSPPGTWIQDDAGKWSRKK